MGVQRAKPIDLSAGNEPFHINGGRGVRMLARCLQYVYVWAISAARFHMVSLTDSDLYCSLLLLLLID